MIVRDEPTNVCEYLAVHIKHVARRYNRMITTVLAPPVISIIRKNFSRISIK